MLKNMLMVIPEETNVVEKVTRMFKRAFWKIKQKSKPSAISFRMTGSMYMTAV